MYAHSIFLADSIISQPDRKVNHWTTNSKSPFYKPIKRPIYSSATFGERFAPYKSPGPYGYIGRPFFFSLIPLGKVFSSFSYVIVPGFLTVAKSGNQRNIALVKRGIGQCSKLSSQNTPSLAPGKEPENCNQSNFGLVLSP